MEIKCQFKKCTWRDGERYTCYITSATIKKPRMVIKAINGIHQKGMTDEEVTAVAFEEIVVEYFPLGLDAFFPNLTAVQVSYCGLKKITRDDLAGLENLVILSFPVNKLTSLPDELFKDMSMLQWAIFRDNELRSLSVKLLESLDMANMREINFKDNCLIDACYKKDGCSSLRDLMNTIEKKCMPPVETIHVDRHMERAFNKYRDFHASDKFTDFTIKYKGMKFNIHKSFFASQSSVFEEIFTNGREPVEQIYNKLKDFSDEAIKEFLNFFYSGEVRTDLALEVFELAIEFDVHDLEAACEEFIVETLEESNLLQVYNLGYERSSENLKLAAFAEIMKIFPDLDELMFDEVDIINDLMKTKRRLDELNQIVKDIKSKR